MRLSPLNQRICPLLSSLSAWSISSFSSFTSSSGHSSFWVNWPALRRKRNLLLGMVAITWPTEKTEHCVRRQADKLPAQRRKSLIDGERELKQENKHSGKTEIKRNRFACYLSPDKLSQPEENTPHPLFQVQRLTAEWLPSKLHNHNLHKAQSQIQAMKIHKKTCLTHDSNL